MRPGQTPSDLLARGLPALDRVMAAERPDLVLVQGDTTTALGAALAAFHRTIPVAHLEAGLRTGRAQDPFPEEMNRRLISSLSVLHFAPTRRAMENLMREGVDPKSIRLCGNTIVDALERVKAVGTRPPDEALKTWVEGDGPVVLLTCHRRESFGAPMRAIFEAVVQIITNFPEVKVVFPVHPNPAVGRVAAEVFKDHHRVRMVPPLDYFTFLWVLERSYMAITDSGGVQEEAPSFGVPVVVTRDATERMEGVEAGMAFLAGRTRMGIYNLAAFLLSNPVSFEKLASSKNPYGDGKASRRVADAIQEFQRHEVMVPVYS
jgi:UDP-N-acetylglucosamine 2-epimerase (non-hydrolysing)